MKHCAECRFGWLSQEHNQHKCLKLDTLIEDSNWDENEHCWLEDTIPEDIPELWKEALDACSLFDVECGRPEWMDDNELFSEMFWYEIGDEKSQDMIEWINSATIWDPSKIVITDHDDDDD
jgi:hypothetical protein